MDVNLIVVLYFYFECTRSFPVHFDRKQNSARMQLIIVSILSFLGKVDEKATQLHAIASLKVLLDATKPQNGAATSSAANHISSAVKVETALAPPSATGMSAAAEMPNGVANALAEMNLDAVRSKIFRSLLVLFYK